ncbi:MAG: DUF885 domain-containing protein [Theionarchaea archaeon]|nr:DUF885 domain-containing protein [Theionarchaea archaeon]
MNDEFDALVHEAFYTFMDFRPDFATFFGLHQYDTKMPSGTKESQLKFIEYLSDYLKRFQDLQGLSPENLFERNLMISLLKYYFFEDGTIRQWEKDPDPSDTVGLGIFPLFSREYAPFEERLRSITARLQQCPQFINEFKTRIETPVKLWSEIAIEGCNMLPMFFQIITTTAQQKGLDTGELEEAAAKTTDALTEYVAWLTDLPCEGEAFLGRDLFEGLLKARELGLTSDEILKIGEDYLRKEKEKLKYLASQIDPTLSVEEVRNRIREEHPPTFAETLKEYDKAIAHSREVVVNQKFATVPDGERLVVMETPSFMRHIVPVAAYQSPARFEEDQMGVYIVTPVEEDSLKEHNYPSILNTSVHEGYPGHHLQLTWANKHPSLVRALSNPSEFIEGWAHYCEERMRNYGLQDIKVQIVQTLDVIFRAVRIIIDVKLHRGEMTFDESVSLLKSETGMGDYAALAEVKRYTKTPGQPLSYLLGKHLLLELQKEVQAFMKEKYSEKAFHDAVLQGGSLPFAYLREELKVKGML